jgi:hypothetical protein
MDHADSVGDVHRDMLPVEADRILLAPVMQLADWFDAPLASLLKPLAQLGTRPSCFATVSVNLPAAGVS